MLNSQTKSFNCIASVKPSPVCVTAFIAPQSLITLDIYSDGSVSTDEKGSVIITVGTYMSDHSIGNLCNFTNAANALNYAFMLRNENCPISKMPLLYYRQK